MSTAAELVASKRFVLLDFDGPICSVFGGVTAEWVAVELQRRLGLTAEHAVDMRDPFDLLKLAAEDGEREAELAERELTRLEVEAVHTAIPTPGVAEMLHGLTKAGHTIAVVSNNSEAAARAYLYEHELAGYVQLLSARSSPDPGLLKPNPHLLNVAIQLLGAQPDECVIVGDSITDIEAAHAAEVAIVAYANKPGKRETLASRTPNAIAQRIMDLWQPGA